MNRRFFKAEFIALIAVLASLITASARAETTIRMEAPSPGSSPYVLQVSMQSVWQKYLPVKVNVTSNMASSRSALNAAKGNVDFYLSSPTVNRYMASGTQMYAGMSNAPELYKNLREVFHFPLGKYHIVVHADSDITSLKQIKGKRVFLGPPGGAATDTAIKIVKAVTGYEPGTDYQMARLDWQSGNQAFQDDQVALLISPPQVPGPSFQQVALLHKVRFLPIPEEAFEHPELKEVLNATGFSREQIPADAYGDNQVNTTPVDTIGSWVGIGTSKFVDEELVYQCTKTIFEHIDEVQAPAKFLGSVNIENALKQMSTPLHAGAVRYYREKGISIPSNLIPPEVD
ncbi:MAG: TAXI family TRAP transporter solute-binding subunit [Alloalcanivorax xenomutans]